MCAVTVIVSGPKFIKVFLFILFLITQLTACGHLNLLQRYLQSKSKVALRRAKFWTFFAFPNFKRAVPPKVVPELTRPPSDTSRGSFVGLLPLAPKL